MDEHRRIPSLGRTPLEAFVVGDYATTRLWAPHPEMAAGEALSYMRNEDFDVAPVRDARVWRYIAISDDPSPYETVDDIARPINVADVVTLTTPLFRSVERLTLTGHLFVVSAAAGVDALVTVADLQRPAVGIAALSMLLVAEAGVAQLIRENYTDDEWRRRLSEGRLSRAREVLESRVRHNAQLDLLDCLMLDDRLDLMRKHPQLLSRLGYTRSSLRTLIKRLSNARDVLAHAGNLLSVSEDPQDAIRLFIELRQFTEKVWELVQQVPWHWESR